ncbi:unnamed protein product [Malus baccata var. baccata]
MEETEWVEKTRDGLSKCNFDAAWDEQRETGGVWEVIRNEVGEFVAAMAKQHTGICSLLLTETMAARDAALFVHEQQVPAVEIEDDALSVMDTL